MTRSRLQRLIKQEFVHVEGQPVRSAHRLNGGETVTIRVPPPAPLIAQPEDIPLKIIYEDEHLIVVDKPRGMVVHPAAGHHSGTLVNALLAHCDLKGINDRLRPGIVHRLDKDTTGILVVAKDERTHLALAQQIKDRTVQRSYLALVHGVPTPREGIITTRIGRHPIKRKRMAVLAEGGRIAITRYRVDEVLQARYSLLTVWLETGRTHQIRVHMEYIGHPVLGDPIYGRRGDKLPGQALHAARLGFTHPATGQYMEFASDPPADFQALLASLRVK